MTQHIALSLDEVAELSEAKRTKTLLSKVEAQHFERKSARLSPADLGDVLSGFGNAEGGLIVVGIHDKKIQGLTPRQANDLAVAPIEYVEPPVPTRSKQLACVDAQGNTVYVMVFEVSVDGKLHKDRAGEVFLRVGDRTKRLSALEAQELAYEKGPPSYDAQPKNDAVPDDLDPHLVADYARTLSDTATPEETLGARGLLKIVNGRSCPTVAALLLFGRHPQAHLPGARLRVLAYRGTTRETGTSANTGPEREFDVPLPAQIREAVAYIATLIPTTRRLDPALARFADLPIVPQAAWEEAVVNAVAHRSYSLAGDHIRVEVFADRIEITSPGALPAPVSLRNIKGNHYARNPLIARVLTDMGHMRETAEGVRRMFEAMEGSGFGEPLLEEVGTTFRVTLFFDSVFATIALQLPPGGEPLLRHLMEQGRVTTGQAQSLLGRQKPATRRSLQRLADQGLLERVEQGPRDPTGYWRVRPTRTLRKTMTSARRSGARGRP